MLFKGRRQSSNIDDLRGSSGRRGIGFKGGIIGTLIMAFVIYILGGDPMSVLNLSENTQQETTENVAISAEEAEMTEFVSVVLADTEDVWNKLFQEMGGSYSEPRLVLFRSAINSACGYAESATGPFYCPGDQKVYIDLDYLETLQRQLGAEGDFAIAYIIAHEVGHHVQNLLGTMAKMDRVRASGRDENVNDATVRLELQADFLAGVWIHHAEKMKSMMEKGDLEEALNAAVAVGDDRIQMKTQGRVVPDSFTHGTSAQRKSWLTRGIQTGDINQGDTFSSSTVL
ncbi:MAG: neutral zinc metallopeptidase [Prolixibacteraceae bacterium]|nr:neutral zinc metallopeptidase [Prolixibacteraceae bacterium]